MTKAVHIKFLFAVLCILSAATVSAQYKVRGTVYDSSRLYRIEAVTVMSTAGRMTMTDTLGNYHLEVAEKDSIWFSYLGKATQKYPVLKMADINQFDIAMKLKSNVMEEVRIRSRSYRMDSIQNRKDYAKIFNYHKPTVGSMTSIGPNGAGIDIQELIRLFQFKKRKATEKFQTRLIEQEKEKFVTHRFSKAVVIRLTNLQGAELENFMETYRPGYEFTVASSDYDFQMYIKKAFEEYKGKSF